MTLRLDDFPAVFGAVYGRDTTDGATSEATRKIPMPFAWQTRLLHRVVERGWPDTIDAPTGAGKTSVLDIALFHLALSADDAACRLAPRRIVFAVDRRVIVDQAFNRACKLQAALEWAADGPLKAMAAALRRLAGGDAPLRVEALRGGMPREDDWARSPVQPTILCTTVDQLGSRLFFRGYGVSSSMAPIHAGLLGQDALLLLDEAHLSEAFRQVLGRVRQRRGATAELARPWAVCSLTATPQDAGDAVFRLSELEQAEPAIATRLAAAKTAELELCKDPAGSAGHVATIAEAAMLLSGRCVRSAPTIAVVVNRVSLARSILQALSAAGHDAILLTGRVRPVERKALLDEYEARLTSQDGATESQVGSEAPAHPLFVVATQCIEVGADFDFDAMVTQIAPLDALRQRFGRLNRLGLRERAPAVIIAARDEIARGHDDPLYQGTLRESWEWLSARAEPAAGKARPSLALGPLAFEALVGADPEGAARCVLRGKDAPVLRAADVALLTMTNPRPHPDPCLPLFLHGEVSGDADVSIVWRADCEIIRSTMGADTIASVATAVVTCKPPVAGEVLRVPIWAAKAWLLRPSREAAEVTDAEGEREPGTGDRGGGGRRALLWRRPGQDGVLLIRAHELRPGDLIVVPASYGGCDRFGWSPADATAAEDIADAAAAPYRGHYVALRLHPTLWQGKDTIPWAKAWQQVQAYVEDDDAESLTQALRDMPGLPPVLNDFVQRLPSSFRNLRLRIERPYDVNDEPLSGAVLIARHGIVGGRRDEARPIASTEDDAVGCFADRAVSLARHTRDVVQQVEAYAGALSLSPELTATLAFAARLHDAGKADPRFQEWLGGGDRPSEWLAKSGRWRGAAAESAARSAAGVPPQWRHEVLSVRIACAHLTSAGDIDPALALYLIGTHHGHGRPFFPHSDGWDRAARTVFDTQLAVGPGPERLDFAWGGRDWAELCAGLQAQYGPWGLAFLEAVLRLADHRASERLG